MHVWVFPSKKRLPILHLLAYAFRRVAISGIESAVVTENATTMPYTSITVGTCETSIYRYLL